MQSHESLEEGNGGRCDRCDRTEKAHRRGKGMSPQRLEIRVTVATSHGMLAAAGSWKR